MENESLVFTLFLIFFGAAVVATLSMLLRQSLIIAYIALGLLIGPSGLQLINDAELLQGISSIGIIFLLFLLGLNLNPRELLQLARQTSLITGLSSVVLLVAGGTYLLWLGFSLFESLIGGAALMFSSTIIALKLIPTTVLHHQHTGEIMISILLLQDIIAIVLLLVIETGALPGFEWKTLLAPLVALPLLVIAVAIAERWVIQRLIQRFDTLREYLFLLAIGWCLGVAEAAEWLGLSYEIGAFIAGVSFAHSPIALYLAENLKPLRDFFLIIFFVTLGAAFDLGLITQIWWAAGIFALLGLLLKPVCYAWLLKKSGESASRSKEVAIRLAQMSEFSLLLTVLAFDKGLIGAKASNLIQFATLISFIVSSTYVVMRMPTPIALDPRLRKD